MRCPIHAAVFSRHGWETKNSIFIFWVRFNQMNDCVFRSAESQPSSKARG